MAEKRKRLTTAGKKKLTRIKREAASAERVDTIMKTIDISVANKLLGGPISAARQRRGARRTGHKEEDLFKTAGEFAAKRWRRGR